MESRFGGSRLDCAEVSVQEPSQPPRRGSAPPVWKAVSIQLHPEFDPDYAKALIELRRGSRYDQAQADAAIESLEAPDDRARLGTWFGRFLGK
jgi:hypothetical protein